MSERGKSVERFDFKRSSSVTLVDEKRTLLSLDSNLPRYILKVKVRFVPLSNLMSTPYSIMMEKHHFLNLFQIVSRHYHVFKL